MLISIGEEREHFGYDAIRDRYVDVKKPSPKASDTDKEKEDNLNMTTENAN